MPDRMQAHPPDITGQKDRDGEYLDRLYLTWSQGSWQLFLATPISPGMVLDMRHQQRDVTLLAGILWQIAREKYAHSLSENTDPPAAFRGR